MATFYIQLQDKLLQISGELTAMNISKALGYVPADSSTMDNYATKDEISDLVDMSMVEELSQRVDNITFDSLKDNPFLQDGSGELNIVDEAGNIIAKVNAEGIHSVDFIAGNHKLTDKIDSSALNGYAKESWVTAEITKAATEGKVDLTGYATEEYVNNIDFYNINNNPIADGEENSLTLVDENGNIGLKVSEDGLYVKDVIADGHTLSQKADKSELSKYATKDEVSDLVDMSVVTELQGKVNTLIDTDADKSVRDIAVDVLTETLVSETATEAYDTLAEMSAWIKSHPEDAAAMNTAIQKNATDITNLDAAYKAADAKVLTDAQEYTDNINFFTIKDNPIVDNNDGSLTFVDESGNIGMKIASEAVYAKDFVAGEHKLSEKIDTTKLATINGQSLVEGGNIEIGGKEYVKKEMGGIHTLVFNAYEPMEPNKVYYCTEKVYGIFIDSITPPTNDVAEYLVYFTTENNEIEPSDFLSSLLWANGSAPTIEKGVTYELSIVATKLGKDYIYKAVLTPFKPVE